MLFNNDIFSKTQSESATMKTAQSFMRRTKIVPNVIEVGYRDRQR